MKRLIALIAALLCLPALADPPGRVGRISYLSGAVSFYADAEDDWQPAELNWPLTSRNSLWTDIGARAEVRIGAVSVRLDAGTQADFRVLDDAALDVFVPRGSLGVRLSRIEKSDRYIVSTPDAIFYLSANGRYRVDVDNDRGESRITVFSGTAQLDTPNSQVNIDPGRAMRIKVANGQVDFHIEAAAATDMDQWALARDEQFRAAERALAPHAVSPAMTGYEDLNAYGTWSQEPEFGAVWYPQVDAAWVPYRYGRWGYVRPWGWTWIDDAPWGFAPFHYGRWTQVRGRWCWHPGRYAARPYYAPALVSWIGGSGSGVSLTAGSPAIGWMPLGPRDYYRPWYGHSNAYINHVNNVTFVNEGRPTRPQPQQVPGGQRPGTTVVLQEHFAGRPIGNSALRVSGEAVANAPAVAGITVLPQRVAASKPLRAGPAGTAPMQAGQTAPQRPAVPGQPVSPQAGAAATPPAGKPIRVAPQAGVAPQRGSNTTAQDTPAGSPASPNYAKPARAPREERQVQQGENARAGQPVSNREFSRTQPRQAPVQVQGEAPQQAAPQGQAPAQQQHRVQQGGAPASASPQAAEKAPPKPKPAVVIEGEAVAKPPGNTQAK
jgi:hypothetical protein